MECCYRAHIRTRLVHLNVTYVQPVLQLMDSLVVHRVLFVWLDFMLNFVEWLIVLLVLLVDIVIWMD